MKRPILYRIFSCLFMSLFSFSALAHGGIQKGFHFTENKGQFSNKVDFLCKLHMGNLFLEKNKLTFDLFDPVEISEMHQAKGTKSNFGFSKSKDESGDITNAKFLYHKHAYSMEFLGALPDPVLTGNSELDGYKNYFHGEDESKWVSQAHSYKGVTYQNLYRGIDVEIYSQVKYLKYDLLVQPGANPSDIKIKYNNIDDLKVLENGDLQITLSNQIVREANLNAYQEINGKTVSIKCKFKISSDNELTFVFPNGYDENYTLVIDPVWVFSTLTGSTADNWGFTSTYDSQGNLYAAGISYGTGYPTTLGAYQSSFGGGSATYLDFFNDPTPNSGLFNTLVHSGFDITISKFSADGVNLLYSTYLGGSRNEVPSSLVVDGQDNLVLLASTSSDDFPTTAGCYDNTFNLGFANTPITGYNYYWQGCDVALTKFNASGTVLIGSTYIGGSDNEGINEALFFNYSDQVRGEVVLDANDNIYVATSTFSDDFPVTNGSIINNGSGYGNQDAVVFRMNANLTNLDWSTYYGGSVNDGGYSLRYSDVNNQIYICGGTVSSDLQLGTSSYNGTYSPGSADGFVASFSAVNGNFVDATYLGTSSYDQAFIIEVDGNGDVFVFGQSKGAYPVLNATYSIPSGSQFIQKLTPNLASSIFNTVIGSGRATVDISPTAFLVDDCGNIYIAGWGGNTNVEGNVSAMPITSDAQQATTDNSDFYFAVIEKNATSLLYGTYLGSSGVDEHVDGGTSRFDKTGVVYQAVCAGCGGLSFPTTPGVYSPINGSSNCNLGAIKFEMNFLGVQAQAIVPDDITLCSTPYDVNFNAPTNNAPPLSQWIYGDGNSSGFIAGNVSPSHTYADTGMYQITYIAIDSSSCNIADTAIFDVTLIQPEQFSAILDIPPIDPCNAPDSLLVSVAFTGTGADSLIWNMGNGDIFYDSVAFDYYYTSQGTYTIDMIAIDNVCNNIDTISETFDYLITGVNAVATAPSDTSFCGAPPYSLDFNAAGSTPNHFWDFGDGLGTSTNTNPTYIYSSSGNYNIMYVAIDSSTCNIADTIYFSVEISQAEELSAVFNLPIVEPCSTPDSILVSLNFTGTGADSLSWNMGDGTLFSDVNSVNYYYTNQGQYIITMQAWDFHCNVYDSITDTVNFFVSYSEANAQVPDDIFLCTSPLEVDFSAGSNPPPHVIWDFGDGSPNSDSYNPTHTYSSTGNYNVTYVAIDSSTCNIADTAVFNVTLEQAEEFSAELDFTPPPPCGSDSAMVDLTFTGSGADSIVWDMGNGDVFLTDSLIYYYTQPGIYIVSMTAYDNLCNNVETISDTVNFIGNIVSNAIVPNVFTPNGDGDNDILKIPNIDASANFKMTIYNRWGRKVFDSENTEFWDGNLRNGAQASEGVYFFEVVYRDVCTSKDKLETGHVNLIR